MWQPNQPSTNTKSKRTTISTTLLYAGWRGISRSLSHCHPRIPASTLLHYLNLVRNSTSSWLWLYDDQIALHTHVRISFSNFHVPTHTQAKWWYGNCRKFWWIRDWVLIEGRKYSPLQLEVFKVLKMDLMKLQPNPET